MSSVRIIVVLISLSIACAANTYRDDVADAVQNVNGSAIVKDVKFILFTRNNSASSEYLTIGDDDGLFSSSFNRNLPVKVIIHGLNGGLHDDINTFLRPKLLQVLDLNVITVDWSIPGTGDASVVVPRVPIVAKYVATFLSWLNSFIRGPFPAVHIIGFSLGGQMAGMVARHSNFTVEFITSLDPANVKWESEEGVRPSDANYVEVIHTNANTVGILQPVGHADFYPNKGSVMTGCTQNDLGCNHIRAVYYYTDSIDHKGFMAMKCNNLDELLADKCANIGQAHMGGASPKNASGVYYLETNAERPYYKG